MTLSAEILNEVDEVLTNKFGFLPSAVAQVGRLIQSRSQLYQPLALPQPICRDPEDDVILGTAEAARADVIITGDKDLLALKSHAGITILRPADFGLFENMQTKAGDGP